MSVKVTIPTQLRSLTAGRTEVEAEGGTIREVIDRLDEQYPGLAGRVLDETGSIRRFINLYLNAEDVRFLDGVSSEVPHDAAISIIPAVAGG